MKKAVILLSVIAIIGVIAFFGYQRMMQLPDIKPAELKLEDLTGVSVDLSYRGDRPAVICFWSTTSAKSQKALPHLKNAYAKYGNQVNFMLISDEPSNDITTFKSLQMLPFFMFRSIKTLDDYGIHTIPALYFFNTKGHLISKKTGSFSESEMDIEIKKIIAP